jgi:hypothetical protein
MKRPICQRTAELLPQCLAGSVDSADWQVQHAHIAWCADCAALVFSHVGLWAALDAWPIEPVPADLDAALRARLARATALVDSERDGART